VIGGIRKTEERDVARGVPFLKDIPVLGLLFSGRDFEERVVETIFILTPTISTGGIPNKEMVEKVRKKHESPSSGFKASEREQQRKAEEAERLRLEAEAEKARSRYAIREAEEQAKRAEAELHRVKAEAEAKVKAAEEAAEKAREEAEKEKKEEQGK